MQIAQTADLHWGIHETGDTLTRQLIPNLRDRPADLFIFAAGFIHRFEIDRRKS